ncbi:lectin-like protein [Luteolibacter marinus]|uniref:lectin-like protein n=1 Tax=Luteolibacter marinus TaxID=2776705 RepID=UPI00186953D8|nr:lectin-like protein [Luteolibacter marinus]
MNRAISVCVALTVLPAALMAQSQIDRDLAKLKEQRDKAVAAAIEPIERKYFERLDQLLKRAIQANDISSIEKIRAQLASSHAGGATEEAGPERPGNVPADAVSFSGNWYRVYLENCRWRAARDKCTRLGGQLVVIPGPKTQEFVRSLANNRELWIGATDVKGEGKWLWVDGSEMVFSSWAPGEPTNKGGGGREEFVHMRSGGGWNDSRDKNTLVVGYICEWRVK